MFKFPPINDITTSYPSPPQFIKIAEQNPKRNYSYPEKFYAAQSAYYKDLRPLSLPFSAKTAYERIEKLAKSQARWKIVFCDPVLFRVEATATTPLMRFKDDVVIEVRPDVSKDSCTVHMRSKSRLGRGDLGANADRIMKFLKLLI